MVAALDLAGKTLGRLTAIERVGADRHGKAQWRFKCACGNECVITGSLVVRGSTTSCGCANDESRAARASAAGRARGLQMTTHGQAARIPEYAVWKSMRQRCTNARCKDFPAYGGRGIRVCARWNDFAAFIADMGRRPSDAHSIERSDTHGNYEPGNCYWADDFAQAANRRPRGTGEYALRTQTRTQPGDI